MSPRLALVLALLPCAAALSGCVAAAIPLVAGGALARSTTDGQSGPKVTVEPAAELAGTADRAIAKENASLTPAAPVETAKASAMAPAPRAPSPMPPAIAQFVTYSADRALAFALGSEKVASAVLLEPASLDGKRLSCQPGTDRPASVLIDLDPGEGMFAEGSPLPLKAASPELGRLRSHGVTIAWISENSAADADIIRAALAGSGLDPEGADLLLLMRYPDDRKQTRREEFAAETCILAMVGDDRRDFDELYGYLTNPDAALALEPLFNKGWFLIGDANASADRIAGAEVSSAAKSDASFTTREEQD